MNDPESSNLRNPLWLFLTVTLPSVCLILLWSKDLLLVREALTQKNISAILPSLTALILYSIGATVTALIYFRKKKETDIPSAVIFLIAVAVTLLLFVFNADRMFPAVEPFILPRERWIIYFFTFLMPGACYAMLVLASLLKGKRALIGTVFTVIGIPLAFFLTFHLCRIFCITIGPRWDHFFWILIPSILLVAGFLFYLGLLKLILWGTPRLLKILPVPRILLPAVFAVFLPVGGLILNMYIPFPCDLQGPFVYICVGINAIVLCLPVSGSRLIDYPVIFLKGAVYWFPFYFFLLFLPWLPLFVPALLAAGAGFLILAPTLLFMVQNLFYVQDYRKLNHPKKAVAAAFFAGIAIVPVLFTANALHDRQRLEYAVRSYYNLPYRMPLEEQKKAVDLAAVKRTMDHLYEMKNGAELPFLDEIYKAVAFRGLVFSDSQFMRMYSDLFNESPARSGVFHPARRFRRTALRGLNTRISQDVTVSSVKSETVPDGAKTEIIVKATGTWNWNRVFSGFLELPAGVYVSGLSLEIGGTLVKGAVTERKSAIWIFKKITESNRDPALLYYAGENLLRFSVFPVAAEGRRVVIDFLYPPGSAPEIKLNGTAYRLPRRETPSGTEPDAKLLSPAELAAATVKREPELIVILDRNMRELAAGEKPYEMLREAVKTFPEAKTMRIASGQLAAGELGRSFPVEKAEEAFAEYEKQYRSAGQGCAVSNIVKGTLLNCGDLPEGKYPVIVLLTEKRDPSSGWNLLGFEEFAPEYPYLSVIGRNRFRSYSFDMTSRSDETRKPLAAARLPDGRIVPVAGGAVIGNGSGKYAEARKLEKDSKRLLRDPSLETELWVPLIRESIRSGVMIPQTSYIVLETEAQRRKLAEVQERKLKGAAALDIENTDDREEIRADSPETALAVIVLGLLLCAGIVRSRPWTRLRCR